MVVDDPNPVPVTVEACGKNHGRYRWHLTDAANVSIRVPPDSCGPSEAAAGGSALGSFGAAQE